MHLRVDYDPLQKEEREGGEEAYLTRIDNSSSLWELFSKITIVGST